MFDIGISYHINGAMSRDREVQKKINAVFGVEWLKFSEKSDQNFFYKMRVFLKKGIDISPRHGYNNTRSLNSEGAWCNGNTWVSKTFVEGSSPSAPAIQPVS